MQFREEINSGAVGGPPAGQKQQWLGLLVLRSGWKLVRDPVYQL